MSSIGDRNRMHVNKEAAKELGVSVGRGGRSPGFVWGAALFVVASCVVGNAQAATLTVTIENVPSARGAIGFGICTEETYLEAPCPYGASEPATKGQVTLVVEDVAPGTYGIVALHDKNENGKLDFKWYGPPSEAYGASNNPPPRMGPAKWEDISFEVGDEDLEFSITLLGAGS
ncbi:MAG: DUF2141 domain-containing protein [Pseudomonadota bacterium]